jgi:methyl-accepting chemotaxis protein
VIPWKYYILKPLSVVTSIADQQVLTISVIATLVLVLAILGGLLTGQRITLPIVRSVAFLRRGSQALKVFSNKEYQVATQQEWIVEASNVALESVRYYTNANVVAADQLNSVSVRLRQRWHELDTDYIDHVLQEMVDATTYLVKAAQHQNAANEKLAATIRVTTQVTEQLAVGARSADEAASQVESAVNQLRSLLGRDALS